MKTTKKFAIGLFIFAMFTSITIMSQAKNEAKAEKHRMLLLLVPENFSLFRFNLSCNE